MTTVSTAESRLAGSGQGTLVPPDHPHYLRVLHFLSHEAALLDEQRVDEWLELLTDDVSYVMPARVTVHRRDGSGLGPQRIFSENKSTLEQRLRKAATNPYAWAEDPPPRSRRLVTNVRVSAVDATTLLAKSYILLTMVRGDDPQPLLLVGERSDTLRITEAGLALQGREVVVDQTSIPAVLLQVPL